VELGSRKSRIASPTRLPYNIYDSRKKKKKSPRPKKKPPHDKPTQAKKKV